LFYAIKIYLLTYLYRHRWSPTGCKGWWTRPLELSSDTGRPN